MPFKRINNLKFFYFKGLDYPEITQAIATRHGGSSPAPWESLNVGGTVGDSTRRVEMNIQKIFSTLNLDPASKYDVWQIHSSEVQIVDKPRGSSAPVQADSMITDRPQITLFMRFADCVPIFLYDPVVHAIGIVHAGREGLAKRAPSIAVEALTKAFGVDPKNLIAGIGPSICPECYEVGEEIYQNFVEKIGEEVSSSYFQFREGCLYLDLWSCARFQLQDAGVEQIELSNICTATNLQDWYSHRGEMGKTGRFAALLHLNG
jgi:YfiH family protein